MKKNSKDIDYFIKHIISREISVFGDLIFYLFVTILMLIFGGFIIFQKLIISLILAFILVIFIRSIYFKDRPIKQEFHSYFQKIESSSFPSMHAVRVTLLFLFVNSFFDFENFFLFLFTLFLLFLTLLSRYVLKKHFITDIIAGVLFGLFIYIFVISMFSFI